MGASMKAALNEVLSFVCGPLPLAHFPLLPLVVR